MATHRHAFSTATNLRQWRGLRSFKELERFLIHCTRRSIASGIISSLLAILAAAPSLQANPLSIDSPHATPLSVAFDQATYLRIAELNLPLQLATHRDKEKPGGQEPAEIPQKPIPATLPEITVPATIPSPAMPTTTPYAAASASIA